MSDRTRNRINAAFDDELSGAAVPPGLRAVSIRAAVTAPKSRSHAPELLALVAAVLVLATIATLVVGTRLAHNNPLPAGTTVPPAPIANAASAFDQAHGQLVIFGGNTGSNPPTNQTWTWDGKYWRQLHPSTSPSARSGAVMAFDSVRNKVILYGGSVLKQPSSSRGCCNLVAVYDTWTWDGATWHQMHPSHQPVLDGFEQASAMQFDPVTKRVALFGLSGSATPGTAPTPELWTWNGSDWQKQPTAAGMPISPAPLMNDGQHLLLLETGMTGGRYVTQTWEWGGDNFGWAVLKPSANLPVTLGFVSAAYDPGRKQLVLLTGGDTWTWDGSIAKWMRQHPALQPQAGGYMAYVHSLHAVVSWGDRMASVDNEMFAWDGSNWKLFAPGSAVWPTANGKGGFTIRMTADTAASTIRLNVKNTRPVLLPTSLPSGGPWDALVSVTPDDFNVQYDSDQRDKTIELCICAANPPPGTGPNVKDIRVRFRNALALKYGTSGYAEYFVYDTTDPQSQRWLMWLEPGSAKSSVDYNGGVYYFLSASGLTDQEFWQTANSLR